MITFNRAAMLMNAIDSLFAQQTQGLFSLEVVVVDDGSTDGTSEVVERLAATAPVPVRFARQENQGVGSARNRSVREAEGEWIAFFDDDQIASAEWLYHLYRTAMDTGAVCVGGPVKLLLPEDCPIPPVGTVRKLLGENPLMSTEPTLLRHLDPRSAGLAIPGTGNALVSREVFWTLGGFEAGGRYGEDFQFFRKLVRGGCRLAIAPEASVQHVIPPERMDARFLLPLARRDARVRAENDRNELRFSRVAALAALRLVHLCWTVPTFSLAVLMKKKDVLLAKRCSIAFCLQYLRALVF